jgi:hypothetical protein
MTFFFVVMFAAACASDDSRSDAAFTMKSGGGAFAGVAVSGRDLGALVRLIGPDGEACALLKFGIELYRHDAVAREASPLC